MPNHPSTSLRSREAALAIHSTSAQLKKFFTKRSSARFLISTLLLITPQAKSWAQQIITITSPIRGDALVSEWNAYAKTPHCFIQPNYETKKDVKEPLVLNADGIADLLTNKFVHLRLVAAYKYKTVRAPNAKAEIDENPDNIDENPDNSVPEITGEVFEFYPVSGSLQSSDFFKTRLSNKRNVIIKTVTIASSHAQFSQLTETTDYTLLVGMFQEKLPPFPTLDSSSAPSGLYSMEHLASTKNSQSECTKLSLDVEKISEK